MIAALGFWALRLKRDSSGIARCTRTVSISPSDWIVRVSSPLQCALVVHLLGKLGHSEIGVVEQLKADGTVQRDSVLINCRRSLWTLSPSTQIVPPSSVRLYGTFSLSSSPRRHG